jgi:hypothetical protein
MDDTSQGTEAPEGTRNRWEYCEVTEECHGLSVQGVLAEYSMENDS